MALYQSFYLPSEEKLSQQFFQQGYVLLDVDDRPALDELRQQVENSEKERRNMAERMEQARTRIEQLIQQLPETTSPEHS